MRNAEIRAELQTFFSDLPQRMAETHLVIARSGAGTVAELMAIGRPAILVPLPGALDDNQTPNADILAARRRRLARGRKRDLTPGFIGPDADRGFSPIRWIWPAAPPRRTRWPRRMRRRSWPMWSRSHLAKRAA